MFCTNCGKRIIDTARFCNYCGTKIVGIDENRDFVSDNITDNPVSPTPDNVINTENVENSGNLLKMTASVPSSIPKMNEIPKSGYSPDSVPITPDAAPDPYASPAASVLPETETAPVNPDIAADPYASPAVSVLPETETAPVNPDIAVLPKEETPRKYTLGHLIMCLAASGVMAIAAGIFAGLYFSVV